MLWIDEVVTVVGVDVVGLLLESTMLKGMEDGIYEINDFLCRICTSLYAVVNFSLVVERFRLREFEKVCHHPLEES